MSPSIIISPSFRLSSERRVRPPLFPCSRSSTPSPRASGPYRLSLSPARGLLILRALPENRPLRLRLVRRLTRNPTHKHPFPKALCSLMLASKTREYQGSGRKQRRFKHPTVRVLLTSVRGDWGAC